MKDDAMIIRRRALRAYISFAGRRDAVDHYAAGHRPAGAAIIDISGIRVGAPVVFDAAHAIGAMSEKAPMKYTRARRGAERFRKTCYTFLDYALDYDTPLRPAAASRLTAAGRKIRHGGRRRLRRARKSSRHQHARRCRIVVMP